MRGLRVVGLCLWCAGCPPEEGDGTPPPVTDESTVEPSETGTDRGSTSATGATGASGDTSSTPTADTAVGPTFDCLTVPVGPTSTQQLAQPRGYHDLAFDTTGFVVGSDGSALIRADYYGTFSVFVPALGTVQGMDWLPNGDLVVASDWTQSLIRITPAGAQTSIANNVGAYGVMVGPDGHIYSANHDVVERVDPYTGVRTTLADPPGIQPRVINFSPDFTKLYMGTRSGSNGTLYVLDLDASLDPVGNATVFATGVGSGSYHDALGVDACGNLYVPDFSTNDLFRIAPDGTVSLYLDMSFTDYGHGVTWGSGIAGWRDDAIYMPQPYNGNTVLEIVVGVPSRSFPGIVLNAP